MAKLKAELPQERLNYTTVEDRKRDLGENLKDVAAFLGLVGFVALFLGFVGFFAILLGFLPFTSLLAVVLASWLTAYSFLESIYERKNSRFASKLKLFFQDAIPNFLLGFFFNLLLFVPFLNVFLLGYAQVLATLVALRREQASTDRR